MIHQVISIQHEKQPLFSKISDGRGDPFIRKNMYIQNNNSRAELILPAKLVLVQSSSTLGRGRMCCLLSRP